MNCRELEAYTRLPRPLTSSQGAELTFADGHRALDLYGGHCVNTLGAGDAGLAQRLRRQWNELSFATNLFDHAPRAEFLQAFGVNLPPGDWRVFVTNSGAEANENALKAALASTGRDTVLAFEGAFHGRTAAADAVTDGAGGFPRAPFHVRRVPFGDLAAARAALDSDVGACILEPIQSMAGVVVPPSGFLEGLAQACDAVGCPLIFDEVQTGNGRLGQPFAAQHFGVVPAIFTTAKGAAGGFPIGLTVLAEELTEGLPRGLFGSTFGGGPMALAAATEVAQRIARPGFLEGVRATSEQLIEAARRGPVTGVRGAGLLLGLELEPDCEAKSLQRALFARGVFTGTCNDPHVLRLSPPLDLPLDAAHRLAEALEDVAVLS